MSHNASSLQVQLKSGQCVVEIQYKTSWFGSFLLPPLRLAKELKERQSDFPDVTSGAYVIEVISLAPAQMWVSLSSLLIPTLCVVHCPVGGYRALPVGCHFGGPVDIQKWLCQINNPCFHSRVKKSLDLSRCINHPEWVWFSCQQWHKESIFHFYEFSNEACHMGKQIEAFTPVDVELNPAESIHMKSLLKSNCSVPPEKTEGRVYFLVVRWVYGEHRQESGGRPDFAEWTFIRFELCVWRLQDMESSLQVLKLLFCFWNWTESWQQRQEHECYSLRLSNSRWQGRQTASVIAAFSLLWKWSTFKGKKRNSFSIFN